MTAALPPRRFYRIHRKKIRVHGWRNSFWFVVFVLFSEVSHKKVPALFVVHFEI
jgi:hypothetical protein